MEVSVFNNVLKDSLGSLNLAKILNIITIVKCISNVLNYFLDCIRSISTAEHIVNTPAGIFISHHYFFGIPWEIQESYLLLKYILFNVFHVCLWCLTGKNYSENAPKQRKNETGKLQDREGKRKVVGKEDGTHTSGPQVLIWERARKRRWNRLK